LEHATHIILSRKLGISFFDFFRNTKLCQFSVIEGTISDLRYPLLWLSSNLRHFVPGSTVKVAPAILWVPPAPLLEEERNPLLYTLIPNRSDPLNRHLSAVRSGLSAHDHPVDSFQVYFTKITE
jgi:hypothetical protein